MKGEELGLKGDFTQEWLLKSEEYYKPIRDYLYCSQLCFLMKQNFQIDPEAITKDINEEAVIKLLQLAPLERAWVTYNGRQSCDFDPIFKSINSLNRSFAILLEAAEPLSALALVRLQLENLTYIIAEFTNPFQILFKVFILGKRLNQIAINGKKIVPSEIRKDFEAYFPDMNVHTLYDKYSGFIHPDAIQIEYFGDDLYCQMEGKKKIQEDVLKDLMEDMISINQIISTIIGTITYMYGLMGLPDK